MVDRGDPPVPPWVRPAGVEPPHGAEWRPNYLCRDESGGTMRETPLGRGPKVMKLYGYEYNLVMHTFSLCIN